MKVKITLNWSGRYTHWPTNKQNKGVVHYVRVSRIGEYPTLPIVGDTLSGHPIQGDMFATINKASLLLPGGHTEGEEPHMGTVEATIKLKDRGHHVALAKLFAAEANWLVEVKTEDGPKKTKWGTYDAGNFMEAFETFKFD